MNLHAVHANRLTTRAIFLTLRHALLSQRGSTPESQPSPLESVRPSRWMPQSFVEVSLVLSLIVIDKRLNIEPTG